MLSDIENLDIMLGENHFGNQEREGSLNSNLREDQGVLQVLSLKMKTEMEVDLREILTLG